MMVWLFMILSTGVCAMEGSFESGKAFSSLSQEQSKGLATGFDANKVPGFETMSPPESSLHSGNIDEAITKRLSKSEAAQFIKESSQKRPQVKVEAATDPLFTISDKIAEKPEQALNLQSIRKDAVMDKKTYTCTKGQDVFEKKCRWTKVPVKTGTKKEEKTEVIYIHNYERNQMATTTFSNAQNKPEIYLSQGIDLFKKYYTGKDALSGQVILINTNRIISFRFPFYKNGSISDL